MKLEIINAPGFIEAENEFETEVTLAGAPKNTTYYLHLAFTVPEKTAYFGYTLGNDNNWQKYGDSFDTFFKIETNEEGSWSGKLKGRVDVKDKDFKGSGNYLLKIGRYTVSGKSHSWSENSVNVEIKSSFVSPTSIPTVTILKNTPTDKPVSKLTTVTVRLDISPTDKLTSIKSLQITQKKETEDLQSSISAYVLGEVTEGISTENILTEDILTDRQATISANFNNKIAHFILMTAGLSFFLVASYKSYRQIKRK